MKADGGEHRLHLHKVPVAGGILPARDGRLAELER